VDGEPEPLAGEVLRDLNEAAAFGADQIGGGNANVDIGQLAGVAAESSHLVEASGDREPGRVGVDDNDGKAAVWVVARTNDCRDEVGAR
jgi:hypothetical protein